MPDTQGQWPAEVSQRLSLLETGFVQIRENQTHLKETQTTEIAARKEADGKIEKLVESLKAEITAGFKTVADSQSWERKLKDFAIVLCLVIIFIQAQAGHLPSVSLPH